MRSLHLFAPLALGALAVAAVVPATAEAQTRVIIEHGRNDGPDYRTRRPVRREVAPRIIHVQRVWFGDARRVSDRWWVRHGFRPVTVYIHGNRIYDRWHARRGLREMTVWYRDGSYYRDWSMRGDRKDRIQVERWEREHDRWHRDRDDDRYDRNDRYDRDRDDAWWDD
jgi:hypothetical protein